MHCVHFAANHYTQKNYVAGIIYQYATTVINVQIVMLSREYEMSRLHDHKTGRVKQPEKKHEKTMEEIFAEISEKAGIKI